MIVPFVDLFCKPAHSPLHREDCEDNSRDALRGCGGAEGLRVGPVIGAPHFHASLAESTCIGVDAVSTTQPTPHPGLLGRLTISLSKPASSSTDLLPSPCGVGWPDERAIDQATYNDYEHLSGFKSSIIRVLYPFTSLQDSLTTEESS